MLSAMKASVGRVVLVLFLLVAVVYGAQPRDGEEHIHLRLPLVNMKKVLQPQDSPVLETTPKDAVHAQQHLGASRQLHCSRTDIFPVLGSCRDFYYCKNTTKQELEWSAFRFTCPKGRIFDVDSKVCNIPSLVTGRPECQGEKILTKVLPGGNEVREVSPGDDEVHDTATNRETFEADPFDGIAQDIPITRRERRSTDMQCTNDEVERIINIAQEPCAVINNIDNYVTRVNSMNSSKLPMFDEKLYKGILKDYNRDLEIAQENTNGWRENNSILDAINETLSLAKEFEPKFLREIKVNLERIGIIINNKGQITTGVEEVIKSLRGKIEELKEMQNKVKTPEGAKLIEDLIKSLEKDLNQKEQEYHGARAKYEIPELIKFLEMVRNDAVEIETIAEDAESKIENFETKLIQDSSKFKRHHDLVKTSITQLEQDKRKNYEEISSIQRDNYQLSEKKFEVERDLAEAKRKKTDAEMNLRNLKGRSKRSPIAPAVYVAGALVGGWLMKKLYDKYKPSYWEKEIEDSQNTIRNLESQIRMFQNDIYGFNNRLSRMQVRSSELQREISNFSKLNGIFQILGNEVESIESLVRKAKTGIRKIKGIFEDINQKLSNLIHEAKTAKNELEKNNIRYLIYHEISVMQCIWSKVSSKMILLGECAL